MIKRNLLILLLVLTSFLQAKDKNTNYYEAIARQIPQGKVLTITEFRGNYADEFTRNLISYLKNRSDISFVDYDIHRKVLEETSAHPGSGEGAKNHLQTGSIRRTERPG